MNSINKTAPKVKGNPKPPNQRPGHAPQSTALRTQLRSGVSGENVKRPTAPPAFSPQPAPKAVQSKMANSAVNRKPPVAPPAYRPQQVPKVLQTKSSSVQRRNAAPAAHQPVAPPTYRPQAKKIVQPKTVTQQKSSSAPAAYGPEQRQARPQSRQILLRHQVVQCAFDQLPPEMTQRVANYLDPQAIGNLRLTNQATAQDLDAFFQHQNLNQWLIPGNLENQYPVDEYNYGAICDRIAATNGLPPWVAPGIRNGIDTFLTNNPGADPTQQFWNDVRGNLVPQQIRQLLMDPQFTSLFGRAGFFRRWRNTMLFGGAALAVGVGLYMNRGRLFK